MRILVINGSLKGEKSNTYQLTQAFVEGMIKNEHEDKKQEDTVSVLHVNTLQIKPCLGCFSCWKNTPGKCCLDDDMKMVIEKLLWADVTIWSFPLYYFSVPGALKNLIDRQLPMVLPFMVEREDGVGSGSHPARYDMTGKKTVLISTCGFYSAKDNYDAVCSMFDHMCGKNNYTTLFCGQGELFRVPELKKRTNEYLSYVKAAGTEYVNGGITKETREKLSQLLYKKEVFEKMADASWGVSAESGEKEDKALIFTRQMAALYNKKAHKGNDMVIEMHYTDVNQTYQMVLTKEGSQVLDKDFLPYTTRIETPLSLWQAIGAGEISGEEALMTHQYAVKGDFSFMLNWDQYFGSGETQNDKKETEKGIHMPVKDTNMNIMLIPWIVFWVAAAIHTVWGSMIGIFVCGIVPVIFYKNKKTIYDVISSLVISLLCLANLAGVDVLITVPVSYLAFGVMWTVSGFLSIPLSAHYSLNAYHGEAALGNPLFMKTNRILTFAWGILYMLTPIWTYFIMDSQIAPLSGVINAILPMGMGIFTGWFQKWYPAKVAKG